MPDKKKFKTSRRGASLSRRRGWPSRNPLAKPPLLRVHYVLLACALDPSPQQASQRKMTPLPSPVALRSTKNKINEATRRVKTCNVTPLNSFFSSINPSTMQFKNRHKRYAKLHSARRELATDRKIQTERRASKERTFIPSPATTTATCDRWSSGPYLGAYLTLVKAAHSRRQTQLVFLGTGPLATQIDDWHRDESDEYHATDDDSDDDADLLPFATHVTRHTIVHQLNDVMLLPVCFCFSNEYIPEFRRRFELLQQVLPAMLLRVVEFARSHISTFITVISG